MAAELFRMLDRPVNRKMVRRVYRRMGWGLPARDLNCAKARWMPIKAARSNQVWETNHTLRLVRSARRLVLLLQRSGHLHQAVDRLPVRHPGHRERRRRVARRGRRRSQAGLLQTDPPVRQRIPVRRQKVPKGRLHPGHQPQVHPDPHPRAERPHRGVPRNPQARVHLAARLCQLPAGRGRHSRGVPGLQPEPAALGAKIRPAGRVPRIMGGGT